MSELSREQVEALAKDIRAHQTIATGLGEWCCKCSPQEWRPIAHRSGHVAEALAPTVAAMLDQARAEAWGEGYDAGCDDTVAYQRAEVHAYHGNPYRHAPAQAPVDPEGYDFTGLCDAVVGPDDDDPGFCGRPVRVAGADVPCGLPVGHANGCYANPKVTR